MGKSIASIGPIGILAKIIVGGTITTGDPVTVFETVWPGFNASPDN